MEVLRSDPMPTMVHNTHRLVGTGELVPHTHQAHERDLMAARQAWLPAAAGSLEMVGCWHICCREPSTVDVGLRAPPAHTRELYVP